MGFNSPEEFLSKVSDSSKQAVEYGRQAAIRHCIDHSDLDEDDAARFYTMVREHVASQPSNIVINMRPDEMLAFLATGRHKCGLDGLEAEPKFNVDAQKMMQVERAIGCIGLRPSYASVASKDEGLRAHGRCSVVLAGLEDRTVLISGDSYRLRNPARPDYVNDPFDVIYKYQDMADCRAAAAIMALGKPDLLGGPELAMKAIASGGNLCEALIFSEIAPGAVARIVADDDGNAIKIRRLLDQLNRMAPVTVVAGGAPESDDPQDFVESAGRPGSPLMFLAGDRVSMKPSASNPTVLGTILDVSNGTMAIEWDDASRAVYDIVEAMARIMPAPKHEVTREGEVVYSLPGMDVDTVHVLNALGIDPVSVYSLSSFAMPASGKDDGWRERLVAALESIGIRAHEMHGYSLDESDPKVAFKKAKWVEASLPEGARLVVDASGSRLVVKAGDVDDYVPASPESEVVME